MTSRIRLAVIGEEWRRQRWIFLAGIVAIALQGYYLLAAYPMRPLKVYALLAIVLVARAGAPRRRGPLADAEVPAHELRDLRLAVAAVMLLVAHALFVFVASSSAPPSYGPELHDDVQTAACLGVVDLFLLLAIADMLLAFGTPAPVAAILGFYLAHVGVSACYILTGLLQLSMGGWPWPLLSAYALYVFGYWRLVHHWFRHDPTTVGRAVGKLAAATAVLVLGVPICIVLFYVLAQVFPALVTG